MSTGESPRDFAADLRALAKDDTLTSGGNWRGFFEATADEIERLRLAIADMRSRCMIKRDMACDMACESGGRLDPYPQTSAPPDALWARLNGMLFTLKDDAAQAVGEARDLIRAQHREIERLRAALDHIAEVDMTKDDDPVTTLQAYAREVLNAEI